MKDLNAHFSKKDIRMANSYIKRCSTSLIIRECKAEVVRYYLILVRMTIIKKSNDKCWTGCREKETLLHCWQECKLMQPPWRPVWRLLIKLRIEVPYDPAIPLLCIYPEKMKAVIGKIHIPQCS